MLVFVRESGLLVVWVSVSGDGYNGDTRFVW